MKRQRWLIAGLCAAVLCAVCLGLELWNNGNRNAELNAQVDVLETKNSMLTEQVSELSEQNESLKQNVELIESMRQDAAHSAAMTEKELEKMEEEMSEDYWESVHREVVLSREKQEIFTFFMEAELELAQQRETSFSDETVKAALEEYYSLVKAHHTSQYLILKPLGLRGERANSEWELVALSEDIKDYDTPWIGVGYYKTDVTEKEYREALSSRVSQRLMESLFFNGIEVRDGYLYIVDGGGSGFGSKVLEIERVSGSRYRGTVEVVVYNGGVESDGIRYEVEFGVEDVNGNCVISAVKDGMLGRWYYC